MIVRWWAGGASLDVSSENWGEDCGHILRSGGNSKSCSQNPRFNHVGKSTPQDNCVCCVGNALKDQWNHTRPASHTAALYRVMLSILSRSYARLHNMGSKQDKRPQNIDRHPMAILVYKPPQHRTQNSGSNIRHLKKEPGFLLVKIESLLQNR